MKKVLFATTALVATASVAAADVTFGGYGRLGMSYAEDRADASDMQIEHRLRLNIGATAESDNGVSFGVATRLQLDDDDESTEGSAGSTNNIGLYAPIYTISTGGFTLTAGNTSLMEKNTAYWAGGVGYTSLMYVNPRAADGATLFANWSSTTDFQLAATYETNGLTLGAATSDGGADGGDNTTSVLATYAMGNYTASVTHQMTDDADYEDFTAVGVRASLGDISLAFYADSYDASKGMGASISMPVGAAMDVTATANTINPDVGDTATNFGIGMNYDLGGGTRFSAGLADLDGTRAIEAGVIFNF